LSQRELGELVGAHAMTVSRWERGVARPTAYQSRLLQALAQAARRGVPVAAAGGDPLRQLASLLGQAYQDPDANLALLSASNRFPGRVVELREGDVMSKVVIEIAPSVRVASVITTDSVRRLKLCVGGRAVAVFKATEVMVGTWT
jgi:molybdate transport system regulatory protein